MANSASREVKVGDVVEGRYRILKTLGEGGMGTVFLAEHALIKRRVAIKLLHPELATDADVIERFMNEARAAGTLGHPNIVESTDMGFTANHVPYIVFEYLEGTLLTDEIYRVGGLPVRRAMRVAQQIASALHAAHNAGIVHRDLKSDNVFLTDKDDALDHVKVLDFGISRFRDIDDEQTRRGMVMGTPEFMSPEQITAPSSVDRRSDIYALGVILYEMLTARRPFSNDEDPRALMHRIVHNAPPPLMRPELPHGMEEMILERMLAKDPEERYQSMMDVEAALESFTTQDGHTNPRRSRAIAVPNYTNNDDSNVARHSDLIPRPAKMLSTPWPPAHADALRNVALPPPPATAKKPWALYGVATVGLLVGGAGLVFGLRGSPSSETTAKAPAPVQPAPLPAAATPAPRETQATKIQVDLQANVPNARVTFRRRVSAAPASMQIAASDIVELVEVSAPGYKTMRYWLTFDRPTRLSAQLVKGSGLEEASEEATLVALGEVAAPTVAAAVPTAPKAEPVKAEPVKATPKAEPQKVAAAMPAPTKAEPVKAPEPEKVAMAKTVARPEPRKIGKRAVEETKIDATMPGTPAAEAPAAPVPAVTPVEKAPEPIVAKPEPAPAKPAPVIEPEVAKPAIDKATISSVVGQHRPEILKCLAEGKKKMAGMKGTITLQLQVDASGKVRAQVQSTLGSPVVAACAIKAANGWRFPARAGGEMANISYPFTIN